MIIQMAKKIKTAPPQILDRQSSPGPGEREMATPVSTVEPVVSVGTMRRLYALPADLVERIQLFQRNNGIASETEAAKRLLEEALPLHDTVDEVIYRFNKLVRARQDRLQAAKEVLVGHPLISWLKIEGDTFSYQMHGYEVKLLNNHGVHILDPNGKEVDYDDPDPPMSADEYPPKKPDWAR